MRAIPPDSWCVLRTAGPRTLSLAESLSEAGFDVWTPTVIVKRRLSRRQQRVDRLASLTPTFVFARADRLQDLARIARSPVSDHAQFSVFRCNGRDVTVADREIERLREAVIRATPRRRRPTVALGSTVRPDEGAYAGMSGVVKASDGKFTLVAFGGWMDVQIETLRLLGDDVEGVPA